MRASTGPGRGKEGMQNKRSNNRSNNTHLFGQDPPHHRPNRFVGRSFDLKPSLLIIIMDPGEQCMCETESRASSPRAGTKEGKSTPDIRAKSLPWW